MTSPPVGLRWLVIVECISDQWAEQSGQGWSKFHVSDAIGNHVSHWHVSDTHFVRLRRHLPVSLEFADALIAARFERYLKTGSGRAFAKRHFGDESAKKGIILKA